MDTGREHTITLLNIHYMHLITLRKQAKLTLGYGTIIIPSYVYIEVDMHTKIPLQLVPVPVQIPVANALLITGEITTRISKKKEVILEIYHNTFNS